MDNDFRYKEIYEEDVKILKMVADYLNEHRDDTPLSGNGDEVPGSLCRAMNGVIRRLDSQIGRF